MGRDNASLYIRQFQLNSTQHSGTIPDKVFFFIYFFYLRNPSKLTTALGFTQTLTKWVPENASGRKSAAGA
jgi:hypothetical protein